MVTGRTTEREENVRIVLLTTVKVGIVRIARDLMPTMKGANAHSVRMVIALMATVRNVLLTIVKAVIVRIVLASITIVKVATVRNVLTTAKVVLMVNGMTAPVIKENTRRTTLAAYVSVMPSVSDAATLEEVTDYTTANVTGVVKAPDGGIAIKAEEKGFDGGILTVIMGFDANGAETGIWVDASTQTKGIGSNVSTDDFLAQFNGMDGTKNIVMNQDFDAYSGATISSTALFAAINDCINCFNELA